MKSQVSPTQLRRTSSISVRLPVTMPTLCMLWTKWNVFLSRYTAGLHHDSISPAEGTWIEPLKLGCIGRVQTLTRFPTLLTKVCQEIKKGSVVFLIADLGRRYPSIYQRKYGRSFNWDGGTLRDGPRLRKPICTNRTTLRGSGMSQHCILQLFCVMVLGSLISATERPFFSSVLLVMSRERVLTSSVEVSTSVPRVVTCFIILLVRRNLILDVPLPLEQSGLLDYCWWLHFQIHAAQLLPT
jgi:hypothetical protein